MKPRKPKKPKSAYALMKEIRGTWTMNPVTRIQENEKKDTKKRRQTEKRIVRDEDV